MRYYFNTNQYSIIKDQSAVHRIRTCKPFTANDFQDRSLTTRTYGKYDSVVELPYLKLLLPLHCTISCGLSTAYGKVHPCRKLAQCVGFEPTRRINARRLSKPFQYHYGNTAEFSCIAKNIRKEAAETFLAGVVPAGGFEPPFCYHAYSDCLSGLWRYRTTLYRFSVCR